MRERDKIQLLFAFRIAFIQVKKEMVHHRIDFIHFSFFFFFQNISSSVTHTHNQANNYVFCFNIFSSFENEFEMNK